ncbi:hypothetical protein OS122_02550 [Mycolicibacterium mucogenicum]|uniref:hypothetical protein n=1 Tax=Mycolicibacterium mucogenicum TaxID=56689 RepID=UPI00226A715C|nr:hypothetical protein [Mycolicibacterium mucogenicum]MCX8559779.1 hypothetical protein [Mycolicibacterium mucogenicum]
MRYFTDGHFVIRVDTDAQRRDSTEFLNAKAEAFQFRKGVWAEKPNLTTKIAFTGDWEPCSEEDAYAVLAANGANVHQHA